MDKLQILNLFHPAVREWFIENIGTPCPPQVEGWPKIQRGSNVLVSAPTGAGKTLAAFLESINRLLVMGLDNNLPQGVYILYVSPLKALNNDIYKNLDIPLKGISDLCKKKGIEFPPITKAVRTGDTPQYERRKMLGKPPHILITTPESLYLMLTSVKAHNILKNVKYLIIDEIHTMLGTKRGVHLALSVERLENLSNHELVRIGLSATVNPVESASKYLAGFKKNKDGYDMRKVEIVNPVMERSKELKIYLPVGDFRVLEEGTIWPEIYQSVLELIKNHTSTIVFVNNRATAEKIAANVNSIEGSELCMPHHGSISRNKRLKVEEIFKNGSLKCLVATSTLELGIDIGHVDLMVQIAPPHSVSSGLQRLGRAGHSISATSKGRIIPRTRTDLVKAVFICKEMLEGNIEAAIIPYNCLDVLAQHIVSISCAGKKCEKEIFDMVRCAHSYNSLKKQDFNKILSMLSGDYEHMEDIPAKPRIIWNRQDETIEGNAYSRMLAFSSGGTIPDRGYYPVYLEDYSTKIGELDEVFVYEARIGDRFMLGNSAWKLKKIEKNRVIVSPSAAFGAKTPFWQGDGIGAPYEKWIKFGKLLDRLSAMLDSDGYMQQVKAMGFVDEAGAVNLKNYLFDQIDAVGCLSTHKRIVIENLSDDVAEQRIVIHSHFGGKVNSVLAVLFEDALEKAIKCSVFTGFTNDAILIHLYGCKGNLSGIFSLLSPNEMENTLLSKLPGTSRFAMTFRYNAYRALMMGIRQQGKRLPLWIQRLRSVDALETAQKYMDHPLIIETMRECMGQIFDLPNTKKVLEKIRKGEIEIVEKMTFFPSPFASELLLDFKGIMMYEEKSPHPSDTNKPVISGMDALGLDLKNFYSKPQINEKVFDETRKQSNAMYRLQKVTSQNELHSFLLIYGDILNEAVNNKDIIVWLDLLEKQGRTIKLTHPVSNSVKWIASEEAALYKTAENIILEHKSKSSYVNDISDWTQEESAARIVRRYARYNSPFSKDDILKRYNIDNCAVDNILNTLMSNRYIIAGQFAQAGINSFCHSIIYERAVKKSMSHAALAVKPKSTENLACFMPVWQNVARASISAEETLYDTIKQMEGLYLPAGWWESIVFPARIKGYFPGLLDALCGNGRVFWRTGQSPPGKSIALAWFCTENMSIDPENEQIDICPELDEKQAMLYNILKSRGASFTHILTAIASLPASEAVDILEELVIKGLVVNDSFQPVRYYLNRQKNNGPSGQRPSVIKAKRAAGMVSRTDMGRWELASFKPEYSLASKINTWFLRYGILCREIITLEQSSFTWSSVYEQLKKMEYTGNILRGYFISGISGIQFMLPEAERKLNNVCEDIFTLNACDPSQVYGRIVPHSKINTAFMCVPGTAFIIKGGKALAVLERYGERISLETGSYEESVAALEEFKKSFDERRIWPDIKKLEVKIWPEDNSKKNLLQSVLKQAGFEKNAAAMVLWKSYV